MSEHTPGPWEVEGDARGFVVIGPMIGDGNIVATVERGEADARLVAAAPDLLAACRLMYETCVVHGMDAQQDEGVRAAIAKALGS